MRGAGPKRRRLRVRRKRKGERFGSRVIDAADVANVPDIVGGLDFDVGDVGDVGDVAEVVGHMGCCVVEAAGSLAVLVALLTIPAYLLMR